MRERSRWIQRAYHSRFTWPVLRLFINDAYAGALPSLRAATDPTAAAGGQYFGPSGPFQLTGGPAVVQDSPVVHDAAVGATLWEFAQTHTGVVYP